MDMTTRTATPRERLLGAANELFYGRGINATGVDAVLRRADVARNTLYHHFGGKDELVAEYLRQRDRRWRADWERCITARDEPVERLLAIFDALAAWWDSDDFYRGCAFVDAVAEISDPDHPVSAVVAQHMNGLRERLTSLAADAGADQPASVADDVLLIFEGAITCLLTGVVPDAISRARALATVHPALAPHPALKEN